MNEIKASKDKLILGCVIFVVIAFIASIFIFQKDSKYIEGLYVCAEVSDASSQKKLSVLPLKINLADEYLTFYNDKTKKKIFEGSYSVKTPPRGDKMEGSEQINVQVKDRVFSPSLYYFEDKISYLDNTTDKNNYLLYIFKREK
jgi:hypothetical protein